jgi:hypothetical protein
MSDDFESLMGKMGVQTNKGERPARANTKERKQVTPRDRHLASTKGKSKDSGHLDIGLEELVQSGEVQKFKDALEEQENLQQNLQEKLKLLEAEKFALLASVGRKEERIQRQENQLQDLLLAKKKEVEEKANLQDSIQKLKESIVMKEQEKQKLISPIIVSPKEKCSIFSLFEERGVVILDEQFELLKLLTGNSNFLTCFQTMEVDKKNMQELLRNEVHLIGKHLAKGEIISGTVLSVPSDRCELSSGYDLQYSAREIVTEMLMGGFKKMAVIGVPKAYNGLLRELFIHESILVSIFGVGDLEPTALNSYDLVIILNEEILPDLEKGSRNILRHPLSTHSLGSVLHTVSEEIPQITLE